MNQPAPTKLPTHFGFLLVNDFTLISMSSAVEPLRMANRICNKNVYQWKVISETGAPVSASDDLLINVDCGIEHSDALAGVDVLVVCGGWNIEQNTTGPIIRWLRSIARGDIGFGSTCTGSYVLAKAGLLDGFRCSVHWENIGAMTDLFPNVHVSRSVYTIDRNRYTCSGGISPVDMMLSLIKRECGSDVSAGVAEQFIYERIRRASDKQRVPLKHVVGNQSEKLIVAVELMEANVRELISQTDISTYTGVSRRQLQRLFQRYLLCTPSRYYSQIRLARARELLHQTSMSLVEISALTGFVSSSHFSKSYKEHFGHSPSAERKN
jgi:transcriptional regulator GlxA family with amidase domain